MSVNTKLVMVLVRYCGVAAVVLLGCRQPATAEKEPESATIVDFLAGSSVRCLFDDECDTGACYQGRCAGVLTTDALWAQRLVGKRVIQKATQSPDFGRQMAATLREALLDVDRSPTQRSRIIALLAMLTLEQDSGWLNDLRADKEPLVRLRVLEALTQRGDVAAAESLLSLTSSKSEALSMFAVTSLGSVVNEQRARVLSALTTNTSITIGARLAAVRSLARWCAEIKAGGDGVPVWYAPTVATLTKITSDTTVPFLHFDAEVDDGAL